MDKFDQAIKNAMKPTEPSPDFVNKTMAQIEAGHKHRVLSWKVWAPALSGALVLLVVVLVALPSSTPMRLNSNKSSVSSGSTAKSSPASSGSVPTKTVSLPAGSDDASLASDLNGIGSAINQEASDQNSANSALNDQSQEITIPTN